MEAVFILRKNMDLNDPVMRTSPYGEVLTRLSLLWFRSARGLDIYNLYIKKEFFACQGVVVV